MRRLAAWAAAALALSAAPAVARAEASEIERGRELFRQADFASARSAFEAALESEPPAEERAVAHVHLAAIAIVFDELDEARARALRAVVHNREVVAPPGAPRALEPMLREARARLAALTLEIDGRPIDRGSARVELLLVPPGDALVAELSLACRAEPGAVRVERGAPPRVAMDLEHRPFHCRGEADDGSGATLARVERDLFRPALPTSTGAPRAGGAAAAPPAHEPDAIGLGVPLAIAAGVVLLAGASVLVIALASSEDPTRASFRGTQVLGWP